MFAPSTQPKWVRRTDVLSDPDNLQRHPQRSTLAANVARTCSSLLLKCMPTAGETATLVAGACTGQARAFVGYLYETVVT